MDPRPILHLVAALLCAPLLFGVQHGYWHAYKFLAGIAETLRCLQVDINDPANLIMQENSINGLFHHGAISFLALLQ